LYFYPSPLPFLFSPSLFLLSFTSIMTFTSSPIKWAHHQHTRLITLCGILLLFVFVAHYTTSPYDKQDPESGSSLPASTPAIKNNAHHRQSLYPPSMFIPDALLHNDFRPISAVVLRTSPDDDTIRTMVDHLHKYPFIKEITIYNLVTPLSTQVRADVVCMNGKTEARDTKGLTWTYK
jgi:hypothetical protein